MTTLPITAGDHSSVAANEGPIRTATAQSGEEPKARAEAAARNWRWFLGQPIDPDAVVRPRRLPITLPRTKDIREHPLYGGALSRAFWRINNYRLTRAGRWFFALTLILGVVGATTLDIQTYIPFVYAAAFCLVALVALPVARPRVRVRVRHTSRVMAGTLLPVEVEVMQQDGRLPGFDLNVLAHGLPLDVDAAQEGGVPIGTLAPGETARVRLGLHCPQRGIFRLGGWRVESDFPLGVLNAYRTFAAGATLVVTPRFTPLSQLEIAPGRRYQSGGIALAGRVGESVEYFGNREFREGDNIRDIDWRATARMAGVPVLREWREEYVLRVAVILDTFVPRPRGSRQAEYETRLADFERAVSLCAAVSDHMTMRAYVVDRLIAGAERYHFPPSQGPMTSDRVLDILAAVTPRTSDTLPAVLPQLEEELADLTSVICVFLDWDEVRRAFVEGLRESGCGVKVILARTPSPTLDPSADPSLSESVVVIDALAFGAGVEAL